MSAGINFIFKDKDYFFLRILSAVTMWKKTKFLARYEVFHRRNTLTDELITHGRFLNDGFLIFSYEFLNHKFFRFFFIFIFFFTKWKIIFRRMHDFSERVSYIWIYSTNWSSDSSRKWFQEKTQNPEAAVRRYSRK